MGVSATQDIVTLLCKAVALLLWSWTSGAVLGQLARRSVWLNATVLYVVVMPSAPFWFTVMLRQRPDAHYAEMLPSPVVFARLLVPVGLAKVSFLVAGMSGLLMARKKKAFSFMQLAALDVAGVALIGLFGRRAGMRRLSPY